MSTYDKCGDNLSPFSVLRPEIVVCHTNVVLYIYTIVLCNLETSYNYIYICFVQCTLYRTQKMYMLYCVVF